MSRDETFRELYRDVASASEGSEELDARITAFFEHAQVRRYPPTDDFGPRDRWQFWSEDGHHFLGTDGQLQWKPKRFTQSVDVALGCMPQNWWVAEIKQICRNGGWKNEERGWSVLLLRRNDAISSVVVAGIGNSDEWTPRTLPQALICSVMAARYAEEINRDVYVKRERETT